jgi:hypothetical protein
MTVKNTVKSINEKSISIEIFGLGYYDYQSKLLKNIQLRSHLEFLGN